MGTGSYNPSELSVSPSCICRRKTGNWLLPACTSQ